MDNQRFAGIYHRIRAALHRRVEPRALLAHHPEATDFGTNYSEQMCDALGDEDPQCLSNLEAGIDPDSLMGVMPELSGRRSQRTLSHS